MGQLDDAVKAYRAATSAHQAAKERVKTAKDKADQARAALAAAIVREALAGTKQVDIIAKTGYSRERVRTILREGGVEPD
jgi:hypothetical protein